MFFGVKKFVGFWIMPLPFCLALILVGLVLAGASRRRRLGRWLVVSGVGLLMLCSNHMVARALMRPLETQHAAIPEMQAGTVPPALQACRYVVVLGSGNGQSPGLSATNELSSSALARITEATRLLRVLPEAKLIVSGPGEAREPTHAVVLARAGISLGIDERRIVLIEQALDTEDEARFVRKLVGDTPVALVTSAWHMPRTAALFRNAGVNALPCPADFLTHAVEQIRWTHFFWEVNALSCTTWAIRERVGYLWIWLRGKT
ncbi:MAG: hypothetical protein RIQ93_3037 [Verrucomicrobiota bacterium]|jgi:uncharacterized SAM-binding protein YcdF (DUF218 family)